MLAVEPKVRLLLKPKRGRKPRGKIAAKELGGRKYLDTIRNYLADLRTLYRHPNRVLFYDDVVVTYLLAFFNPVVRSLRCIEDATQVPGISKHLTVESVCRSTLSDANALFDPAHLQGLISNLQLDLPNLHQTDGQLDRLLERAWAVDGSYFRVAADVQWAMHQRKPDKKMMGSVRLNCQFCLKTGCPDGVSISGDDGMGEGAAFEDLLTSESAVDPTTSRIYLFDSGVVKFSYFKAILNRGHHFLCNLREPVGLDIQRELALDEAARKVGVLSDRIGTLTSNHAPRGTDAAPSVQLREIRIACTDRKGNPKQLRLLTDLLDSSTGSGQVLPASLIAELYKHRWEIELFFRWLKVHANFRHLTSHSKNGVTLSFYIAIIAMLLTCLHTQAPLSIYGYNLLGMVAAGLGDVDDILPIMQNRERQRQMERARQARKRAEKAKTKA